MQGILDFIPTRVKIEYLNALLSVGFDTLDCGSFVSPKAIPQMRDTAEVLDKIDLDKNRSKLSVIVANTRGATDASSFDQVDVLGFPFSISPTFQKRNTNKSLEEALETVEKLGQICEINKKEFTIYISMGFGNPYGEEWHEDLVAHWVERLKVYGVSTFSISDTVGVSNPTAIEKVFSLLNQSFEDLSFGAHFHTLPDKWEEKIRAAESCGCVMFDGALAGYGGCPMAKDQLVGNMPTEKMIAYFGQEQLGLNEMAFDQALDMARDIFTKYL